MKKSENQAFIFMGSSSFKGCVRRVASNKAFIIKRFSRHRIVNAITHLVDRHFIPVSGGRGGILYTQSIYALMKKILSFATLLVTGLAASAAADATLAGYLKVDNGTVTLVDAAGNAVEGGALDYPSAGVSGDTIATSGSQWITVNTPDGFISMADSFSISFTAKWVNTNNWSTLFSFGESDAKHYAIYANFGDSGNWHVNATGYGTGTQSTVQTTVAVVPGMEATSEAHDYILTMSTENLVAGANGSTTGDRIFTLYDNNELVFQFKVEDMTYENPSDMKFAFGGAPVNWNRVNDVISNVAFYNGTYTPGSVPEPATATLSLLALAGLAARRRRK